jgi:plastocyanin
VRRHLSLALALSAAVLVAVAGANAATAKDSFDLKGEVYPNFKIEMKNSANRALKTVKAGTHHIKVEDKSSIHNFHLKGPGVDRSKTVGGVGERVWTVKLKPGKYTYWCDPHSSTMRGSFRVVA